MLTQLAPDLWHATHAFSSMGIPVTSRMVVVRCAEAALWLHSPIAITPELQQALQDIGTVRWIVAPSLSHHLFAGQAANLFPSAQLFGAPGLRAKRRDLACLHDLPEPGQAPWGRDLEAVFVGGIPLMNETVWFHPASGTAILTDLCMHFTRAHDWRTRLYGRLNGVMDQLAVSTLVRLATRDRAAAALSVQQILQWPIRRVLVAHDCVVEQDAREKLSQALAWFSR